MTSEREDWGTGLVARSLSVGYGTRPVLRDLGFNFAASRTSVILGPGGSGKSTLLHALGGRPPGRPPPWRRGTLSRPTGALRWLAQKPGDPTPTVADHLAASDPDSPPEATLDRAWRCASEVIDLLRPRLHTPLGEMELRARRLAELTAATVGGDLLLLDEPDLGLDAVARRWVELRLAALRHRRTLVVATHHLGLARAIADHLVLLVDGAIVEAGDARSFFEEPRHPRTRQFVELGA